MDEQLRILKMIEEGTITAEQGAELMSAMNTDPQELQTAFQTEAIHCTGRDNTLADIPCASVPTVRLGGFPPAVQIGRAHV